MNLEEPRSMELLWDVYPEAADRLTRALASGLYLINGFDEVCDEEYASFYIFIAEFIEEQCACPAGDYLDIRDANEAVDSYIDSIQWLNIYEIPERISFLILLVQFTICREFGRSISEHEQYDPENFDELHGLIEFFGSWVEGLAREDVTNIAEESFLEMKNTLAEASVA